MQGSCAARTCSAPQTVFTFRQPAPSRWRLRQRQHPNRQHGSISRARPWGTATKATVFDLLYVPPMCFDTDCQALADRAFLLSLGLPLLIFIVWLQSILRPQPDEAKSSKKASNDIEADVKGNRALERGKKAEQAYRVVSFTPEPVDDEFPGERVRLAVGPANKTQMRTYVFPRLLREPSQLVLVTLPRPLGVVLEWNEARKRAEVVELLASSNAEQKSKIASLNRQLSSEAALPGDVLRAVTCTNFVYSSRALWGAVAPERHIVLYCADKRKFSDIRAALRMGNPKDGPVTLVLERRIALHDPPVVGRQ